jgi:hypothetical protein
VHSYSAKPTYNNKYYKQVGTVVQFQEYFKMKHNSKAKKKQLIPVRGIRYHSRPLIYPQTQDVKARANLKSLEGGFPGKQRRNVKTSNNNFLKK